MVAQADLFDTEVKPEKKPQFSIRPYQQTMVDNTFGCWEEARSNLSVLPTGAGKTFASAVIAKTITETGDQNYLFFAHRTSLVEQTFATMRAVCPGVSVSIEQGDQFADIRLGRRAHIVVASKDSLSLGRLSRYPKDFFSHITVDEAHHCRLKSAYTRIFDYFETAKYHGVTATPDRTDEAALGQIFESVAFEYSLLDAINDGYLVPIVQQLEYVEGFDLSAARESANGDLKESDIADEMRSKKMLHATATAAVKYSMLSNGFETRRPTLIFCASVEHAEEVANILNDWHAREGTGRAGTINSTKMTTDDVKANLKAFRAGQIQYLTNMGIATEGTDLPMVRVIICARATKSRALYSQIIGRGVRPLTEIVPELNACKDAGERKALIRASRKPGCLIVDLVGNSGQHKLITALDILGGKYDDDVIEKAKANIMARGGRADVDGMQEEMERVDTKAKVERRAGVILKAKLSSRIVDPFDLLDVSSTREPGWFKGKSPTDKMKAMLERNKFTDKEIKEMSFFKAKQVIGKIIERREKGLCSLPQAKTLAKYGFNPDMPFEQAKATIDRIAASGWKLRGDFDPSNN